MESWVLLFKLGSHYWQTKDLSLSPIPTEPAQSRTFMKNVKQSMKDYNAEPPPPPISLSLILNQKGSPFSRVRDLSTSGHHECSQYVYIYHKDSTLLGK